MKKLLLLITLMIGFMSFSPVEKGDLLKVSPMVEDVQINKMDVNTNFDLQFESQWIMTTYNIPIEPGYTVSAPLAGNYVTTFQKGAILNYCTDLSANIKRNRYRQEHSFNVSYYSNLGYPIDENDNFVRWLTRSPERSSLPHNII